MAQKLNRLLSNEEFQTEIYQISSKLEQDLENEQKMRAELEKLIADYKNE